MSHIIEPEELMAYLDGELSPGREVEAAAHLQRCEECQSLAADFQGVSRRLRAWEVGPHELARPAVTVPRRPIYKRRWVWGLAAAVVVLVVAVPLTRIRPAATMRLADIHGGVFGLVQEPLAAEIAPQRRAQEQFATAQKTAVSAPMIVRTSQITLSTRDFDQTRTGIDAILARHRGYLADLNVRAPMDAGRVLDATIRVPADQLEAAMSELKKLGRVESEQRSGEEVTQQFVDLEARLSNAKNTERRLTDLSQRTGKLSDVLEVEREIDRVRGEIEQMEAERKTMLNKVDFATLKTTVTENYKAQLQMAPDSLAARIRNAAVDGIGSMASSVVSVCLFLLAYAPSVLFWAAILFFPARFLWRRARRS